MDTGEKGSLLFCLQGSHPFWEQRCLTEPREYGMFLTLSWVPEEGTLSEVGRPFSISSITTCLDRTYLPYLKYSALTQMRGNPDHSVAIIS